MRPVAAICTLAAVGGVLSACGEEREVSQEREVTAGGKILERSISDEMLPYDTVKSQAPRAKPKEGEEGDAAGNARADGATPAEE